MYIVANIILWLDSTQKCSLATKLIVFLINNCIHLPVIKTMKGNQSGRVQSKKKLFLYHLAVTQ